IYIYRYKYTYKLVCLKGKIVKLGSQVSTNSSGGFRSDERRSSDTQAYKPPNSKLVKSKASTTQVHSTSPYFHHSNHSASSIGRKKKRKKKIYDISQKTKLEYKIHIQYKNKREKFIVNICIYYI